MTGRTIAVVPARAGSVRLPGKNTRPMAGRPMAAWTFDAALKARTLDHVVVSTDDPALRDLATAMGLATVERPSSLAGSDASVIDAVAHALDEVGGEWEHVVLLQPTSPLRTAADVDHVVTACRRADAPAAMATAVLPKPATFHGRLSSEGRLRKLDGELDQVRVVTGAVYVASPRVLFRARTFWVDDCLAVDLPADRAWDVDTIEEFAACEAALLARQA